MTPGVPVLQVSDLSITLPPGADRLMAISNVDLAVHSGEIVCIVGESGSGKSLTGSAIMGLLPRGVTLASGSVRVGGDDIASMDRRQIRAMRGDRVAMIFQEPMTALNPSMRIGAQIAEVFAIHRPKLEAGEVAERVLALLNDVGLPRPEELRSVYPHQLSGGQRQRVVIAMALALEPALVVADEPTTALDVTTQAQILRLFKDLLARRAGGVLLITHDFGVVAEVADRVVVMRQGKVVEAGAASQVLSTPKHEYTRSLINAVPGWQFRQQINTEAPILSVSNLILAYRSTKLFGRRREIRAIDGVSFDLRRGETLGIVGESGSGKSSLARALVAMEHPQSGSIQVDGTEIVGLRGPALRQYRRKAQMIFQDPYRSMNPRQRIVDMLTEGPVFHGMPFHAALDKTRKLLDDVGIGSDVLRRYPHEFSGGQRQRLCIARALAMDPDIIIADEAVSALDVSVQAQVLSLLERLREEIGFSMVFVTHDLRVAANLCDRIGVMENGKLVEIGDTRQIIEAPERPFTQRLVASIPGGIQV